MGGLVEVAFLRKYHSSHQTILLCNKLKGLRIAKGRIHSTSCENSQLFFQMNPSLNQRMKILQHCDEDVGMVVCDSHNAFQLRKLMKMQSNFNTI